jgi:hypothetical protein
MIGSGFPHPDGTAPNRVSMLQAREGLTKKKILTIYWAAQLLNFLA